MSKAPNLYNRIRRTIEDACAMSGPRNVRFVEVLVPWNGVKELFDSLPHLSSRHTIDHFIEDLRRGEVRMWGYPFKYGSEDQCVQVLVHLANGQRNIALVLLHPDLQVRAAEPDCAMYDSPEDKEISRLLGGLSIDRTWSDEARD